MKKRRIDYRRIDNRLKKIRAIRAIRGKETFVSFVKNLCESLWLKKDCRMSKVLMSNGKTIIPHIHNL